MFFLPLWMEISSLGNFTWFKEPGVPVVDVYYAASVQTTLEDEILEDLLLRSKWSQEISRLGAQVSVHVQDDAIILGAKSLKPNAPLVHSLVKKIFENDADIGPLQGLTAATLENEKSKIMESLHQAINLPESATAFALNQNMFKGTPYESRFSRPLSVLRKINLKSIKSRWDLVRQTRPLTGYGVSDEPPQSPQTESAKVAATKPKSSLNVLPARRGNSSVSIIEKKGFSQSPLMIGFRIPGASSADTAPLLIAHTFLTEYFDSRLNRRLRDELGIALQVRGQFTHMKGASGYSIVTSVGSPYIGSALQEIVKIFRDLNRLGSQPQEVKLAKKYLLGSYPLGLTSVLIQAQRWFSGNLIGLPDDYLQTMYTSIEQTEMADIDTALRKYFSWDNSWIVTSGDSKLLKKSLELAGFRSIIVKNPESLLK